MGTGVGDGVGVGVGVGVGAAVGVGAGVSVGAGVGVSAALNKTDSAVLLVPPLDSSSEQPVNRMAIARSRYGLYVCRMYKFKNNRLQKRLFYGNIK